MRLSTDSERPLAGVVDARTCSRMAPKENPEDRPQARQRRESHSPEDRPRARQRRESHSPDDHGNGNDRGGDHGNGNDGDEVANGGNAMVPAAMQAIWFLKDWLLRQPFARQWSPLHQPLIRQVSGMWRYSESQGMWVRWPCTRCLQRRWPPIVKPKPDGE